MYPLYEPRYLRGTQRPWCGHSRQHRRALWPHTITITTIQSYWKDKMPRGLTIQCTCHWNQFTAIKMLTDFMYRIQLLKERTSSFASISAPHSIRSWATATWPEVDALIKGVPPSYKNSKGYFKILIVWRRKLLLTRIHFRMFSLFCAVLQLLNL